MSVTQPGFDFRLVSVIVPPDSGQRIRVNLAPTSHPPTVRQIHNVDDLGDRLSWHQRKNSRIYTRADLQKMQLEWVYDAVKIGYHEIHQGPDGWIDADCSAVANGGPDTANLATLTVDDIESVEIYDFNSAPLSAAMSGRPPPPRPGLPPPRAQLGIDPVPITNSEIAAFENRTKKCTMVYVWLR